MKLHPPVPGGPCWAELGTSDPAAARRFYARVFGWRHVPDPHRQTGGYSVARLGDTAVAGLTPRYRPGQPVAWEVAFTVRDAESAARQVTAAGGRVEMGPVGVFGAGRFTVAEDPSGAVFQLWQPGTFPGAGDFDVPGALGWVELLTREPERAADFYATVFGWSVDLARRSPRWSIGGADFGGVVAMDEKFPHEVPAHWLPYFAVADVDLAAAGTVAGGGRVLMDPASPPGGPRIAVLRDAQGAVFGVHRAGGQW